MKKAVISWQCSGCSGAPCMITQCWGIGDYEKLASPSPVRTPIPCIENRCISPADNTLEVAPWKCVGVETSDFTQSEIMSFIQQQDEITGMGKV